MSLRYQIICRVLLSSLCVLLLGGAIAVWQARQAVQKEVDASIHLAVQLITLGLADATTFPLVDDLSRFGTLQQTRHLSIQLQKPDGQLIHFAGAQQAAVPDEMPPDWFIRWVKGDYPQAERLIRTRDGQTLTLIVQAQPLDEITEVWQESITFFATIALLTMVTFLAVNLAFNKALKSIGVIVEALRIIETGQYRHKLPLFTTQEFGSIAGAINHMTEELEKARQENRALTQHSLAIQEEERQRLSQELHDELGQSLTAIKVMAVTAGHKQADIGKIAVSITGICDHLMAVVRSMMQQLHPLVLTELGLKATLEEMVHHWSERNPNTQLTIACSDAVDGLDKKVTIQVFRVIQECLTNVQRHAAAQHVTIDLQICWQGLQLQVCDDGVGCDMKTISGRFGLLGMKERIRSLDGEMTVDSRPEQGLTVTAWIPLS